MNNSQYPNDYEEFKANLEKYSKFAIPIIAIFIILLGLKSVFYTVEPDEEAVVIRFGKYIGTYPPGLHFKLPFGIERNINVKTKRVLQEEFGFRTKSLQSRRTEYSDSVYGSESLMLTGDLKRCGCRMGSSISNIGPLQVLISNQDSHPQYKGCFRINHA